MTITYNNYPHIVYCDLTEIVLTITQQSPGRGDYVLNLTQNCNSTFDYNLHVRSDWVWTAFFYDATNALLAAFPVGSWFHVCGNRAIRLPGPWIYSPAPDLLTRTANTNLVWTHQDTVLPC